MMSASRYKRVHETASTGPSAKDGRERKGNWRRLCTLSRDVRVHIVIKKEGAFALLKCHLGKQYD
jgi:hypothetical protein